MELILLEKIRNLGNIGDEVTVKAGFARNFLLPYGKAVRTTPDNVLKFEERRAELEKKAKELLDTAKLRAEKLEKLVINIAMKATEDGNLFGSVGIREMVKAVKAAGEDIDKKEIVFSEGAIRQVGEYEVKLQLHSDVTVAIKINVVAE